MPSGTGTYGTKVGRPPKNTKKKTTTTTNNKTKPKTR